MHRACDTKISMHGISVIIGSIVRCSRLVTISIAFSWSVIFCLFLFFCLFACRAHSFEWVRTHSAPAAAAVIAYNFAGKKSIEMSISCGINEPGQSSLAYKQHQHRPNHNCLSGHCFRYTTAAATVASQATTYCWPIFRSQFNCPAFNLIFGRLLDAALSWQLFDAQRHHRNGSGRANGTGRCRHR